MKTSNIKRKIIAIAMASVMVVSTFSCMLSTVSAENIENTEIQSTVTNSSETIESTTESITENTTQPIVNVKSIKLNKTSYLFNRYNRNGVIQLIATVYPNNATNKGLSWKSSNTKVATVNQYGKVTLKSRGTVTITATANDESNISSKCVIRVIQKVTSIKVKSVVNLSRANKSCTVKPLVYPTNADNKSVVWTSSNKKIATVNSNGKIKAKKNGYCTITVKAKDGSGKSAKIIVVVGEKVKGIKLNKTKVSTSINKTVKLKATVSNKTAVYKKISWTSSNTSVATVNPSGTVTGKKKGTVTITAKTCDGSNKVATCKVTIKKLVTKITLDKTKVSIEDGNSVTLKATVTPTDANNKNVTWTTSNKKVATVNTKGKVTAKGAGTATIKATAKDGSKKTASCKVTVKAGIYTKLTTEEFNKKANIDRYCQMLTDYFVDCGAVENPNLTGTSQWFVTDTSLFYDESMYDFCVEIVGLWTHRRATDAVKNGGVWKNIDNEEDLVPFLEALEKYGFHGYKTYNPTKILNKNWNGWAQHCNANDPELRLNIYVEPEAVKTSSGSTYYFIKMYWRCEWALDYLGIPHV